MDKWHIDKKYLNDTIEKGLELLKDYRYNKNEKKIILDEIKIVKKFLIDDFDFYSDTNNIDEDNLTDKIKDKALRKIKKQYKLLDSQIFNYFNALYKSNILEEKMGTNKTLLDEDMQYELILKNYQVNSPYLLEVLNSENKILMEANHNLEYSSYCYYSYINDSQLIIFNPSENCYNLNHELEHALENILDYNLGNYFQEVGSINFEMLFLDILYDVTGYINDGDFEERIFDMYWYLDELIKYFNLMQELSKRDFNVSLKDFATIIMDKMDILDSEVANFVMTEILGDGKDASLTYLFSYLQAIKIRRMHNLNNIDNFELIKPYLLTNKYNFNDLNDFKIYDDYINEMTKRTRSK